MIENTKPNELGKVYPKKAKPLTVHDRLRNALKSIYQNSWDDELLNDLPKKWKICEDLLILPATCFQSPHWLKASKEGYNLWKSIAEVFRVKRVAIEHRVKSDDFRSPNLMLLYGDDPVVVINNNGIKYSYNITKCMFSWGNITEKLRLAEFDCSNEIVVDLFAGIGYFTLVYLVHAKAIKVYACEWNPASCEALANNLKLNKCENRCEILQGDNREVCPVNVADRINLGLIPTSEMSWETAVNALKIKTGGYLHIHANVDVKKDSEKKLIPKPDWQEWALYARGEVERLFKKRTNDEWSIRIENIEYVKSYGPRVDHLVLDLICRPPNFVE